MFFGQGAQNKSLTLMLIGNRHSIPGMLLANSKKRNCFGFF
jgi:hypothetical protein